MYNSLQMIIECLWTTVVSLLLGNQYCITLCKVICLQILTINCIVVLLNPFNLNHLYCCYIDLVVKRTRLYEQLKI